MSSHPAGPLLELGWAEVAQRAVRGRCFATSARACGVRTVRPISTPKGSGSFRQSRPDAQVLWPTSRNLAPDEGVTIHEGNLDPSDLMVHRRFHATLKSRSATVVNSSIRIGSYPNRIRRLGLGAPSSAMRD